MLVHQAKRPNSPCFIATNHDSSFFPNLLKTKADGSKSILKFDKFLVMYPVQAMVRFARIPICMGVDSCILKYVDTRFTLYTVGWRGTSSLRAYVDSNETVHILRLLGADLCKFQVNKFEKAKEAAEEMEANQAANGEQIKSEADKCC